MPADIVVRRIDRVADAALYLDPENKGMQKLFTIDRLTFGQRQNRRGHRAAGMDNGFKMGIIEIEYVRADAVGQRRVQNVEPFGPADDARLRRPGKFGQGGQRPVDGFVPAAADGAAEPIQKRAQCFTPRRFRNIGVARCDDIAGKTASDIHC